MTDTIVNRWVIDRDTVTTSRRRDPKPAFGLISIVAGGDMVLSSDGGGVWIDAKIPAVGKLGTPLLFDAGVFLVVFGVTSGVLFELLAREESA